MNVSVIIPNFNGESLMKNNLPRVLEVLNFYKLGKIELLIADDHSSDDSLAVLNNLKSKFENLYPKIKIKILKNEKNLGFASNINRAVKHAQGAILYLLNSDVIPEKDFLESLINHFKDERVFAVGSMDKSVEKEGTVLRGRGIGYWKRGFLVHFRGEVIKSNTLWVNGGSGAFRKVVWDKLGGFCNIYSPFYWEDIDISYRAQKAGFRIIFEPRSIVIHEHEKGAIKASFSSTEVKKIAYRNQFIFVWKNINDFNFKINHLIWLPYHFISAFFRGDLQFFKGFLSAFLLIPEIIKYKKKEKALYELKDKEVLAPFVFGK